MRRMAVPGQVFGSSVILFRSTVRGGFFVEVICSFLFLAGSAFAQSASVYGRITDASDGSAIWGANILVKGTSQGTISNEDGRYSISQLKPGEIELVFRYIGYESRKVSINLSPGEKQLIDVKLSPQAVKGKEVVVTAQLRGQNAAINQQVNSNTIVNIVSADKLQSLPDNNIAESLGRLPGISVVMDQGEGSMVNIRGLAPQFNTITINGVAIPATNADNRSVDLSMVSSDILGGVEVFKVPTPNQDGNALGGTVDLITKQAPNGAHFDMRLQGGYGNFRKDFGRRKIDLSGSDRFFNNKLGILASLSLERSSRGSNQLNADYIGGTSSTPNIEIADLNLTYYPENLNRYNAGLDFDYNLDHGSIKFTNFFSDAQKIKLAERKRYRVDAFRVEYDLKHSKTVTSLYSSSLGGNYNFGIVSLDALAAYALTLQSTPWSKYARFEEVGAFKNGLVVTQGPQVIPQYADNNISQTFFQYGTFTSGQINEHNSTGKLDAKMPFDLGANVSGFLQGGVKYTGKVRTNNATATQTAFGVIDTIGQINPGMWTMYGDHIQMSNFIEPGISIQNFLNGSYEFGPVLNPTSLDNFYNQYQSWYTLNRFNELNNYTAAENTYAGYVMAKVNIMKNLMILPGFRYELSDNKYTGYFGRLTGDLGQMGAITDTVGHQVYGDFLPMVNLRYQIIGNLDVRLAYTHTLSRPDYFNLVPYQDIDQTNLIIDEGNPNLKHMTAHNYDAQISWFNNYGLFTLGGFYKDLYNIDYLSTFRVFQGQFAGYTVTQPVNSPNGNVYGIEFDAQSNFVFLPSPFNGIIVDVNFTRLHSETYYPYFEIGPRSPNPPYTPLIINTFRRGRLPGQADWTYNVTLGYEKEGFSGRISVFYQGSMLQTVGAISALDGYSSPFTTMDLSASQRVWKNISIYVNATNILNRTEGSYMGATVFPTSEQFYGWTLDIGFRYRI